MTIGLAIMFYTLDKPGTQIGLSFLGGAFLGTGFSFLRESIRP